ncbi:uncharacterized protein [Phyllobates terribilis]|uniref:uncharacterized protein n=1 Tax=Phyllobates terribilis TaxID=111132 RepID=UPI003CCA8FB1
MSINGEILKGPEPDNKLTKAKKIGTWSQFDAMFFDPAGALYAVSHDGELYKGEPPTGEDSSWMTSSTRIGQDWDICQSMCFSPDGKLWCIDKKNGFLYSGDPPAPGDSGSRYLERAQYLGSGYDDLIYFAFVQDKVIQEILSIEFLPDMRGNVSSVPVVLKEKIYDNRDGRRTLRSIFLIQKTITESSSFIQEPSGFTFGPDLTVQCAVPYFSVDSGNISLNMSSGHKWNFMKTNDQEVSFSSSKDVELEAGRAIRMSASVMKAEINVRYKAAARTLLGSEVEISGVWKGVSHYNLVITQEKYTP